MSAEHYEHVADQMALKRPLIKTALCIKINTLYSQLAPIRGLQVANACVWCILLGR
jgi:hypothetical protein